MTYTKRRSRSRCAARAMPIACESPDPKGPDVVSTPGSSPRCGCPWSGEPSLRLRKLGSPLQGHPHRGEVPGVETTSGPLGSGLSQAIGMALAAHLDRERRFVYVITSDGEHDEGNYWEAVMYGGNHGYEISQLTVIVDRNNIQIDGNTEDVMALEPLAEKYRAFGWHVMHIDGHRHEAIIHAAAEAQAVYEAPSVIIAHTVPGEG